MFIVCFFSTEQIFDHVMVMLGLKQSDTNKSSYTPTARSLLAWTRSPQCVDHWLGLWQGGCVGSVSGWVQRAAPETEKLGWEPIARRRVGLGLHPPAWSSSAEQCESLHWPLPALFSPPPPIFPPDGLPAPSPAALFWLLLLGVYIQPALSIPSHFPPSLDFPFSEGFFLLPLVLLFSKSWSVLSLFLLSPFFLFFNPACLILPSLARHRGCKNAQQLLSWHVLHCLLTVLFLLDFIKTPSAVSSGMVERVAEEEMEEERRQEKSERFWRRNGGRTARLTRREQAAMVVSCRRDTGSTS